MSLLKFTRQLLERKTPKPNVSSSTNPEKCASNITAQPRGTFRCCQTVVSTSLSLWESAHFDLQQCNRSDSVLSVTKSHKLKQTALFSTLLWCRWDFRESTPAGHYIERRFKALSKLNFNFSQILYLKTRTFTELLTSSSWSFKSTSLKAVDFRPHLLQNSHISFVLFLSKLSISPRLPLKNQIRSREEHWCATAVFQSFKSFCESWRGRSHWVLRVLFHFLSNHQTAWSF